MTLSIIIVNWNVCQLLKKCLASIYQHTPNINLEIFVIDNASTDNSIEMIKKNFPSVHLIQNKKNAGFTKANNQGIKKAQGDYVLLLNPDTELIDDSIKKLISFLEKNKNFGIVGPKLLNTDLTLQRSCRKLPGLADQLLVQLKFYNLFLNKIKTIQKYFMLDFDHNKIKQVDQIMGAAMLIKKEIFKKIGFLDENIWSVFEEVDFCKRTQDAGFKIFFSPDCKIIHHKEQSFKQMANIRKQINFNHSLYYYFKKHKPLWQLVILWLVQPINLLLIFVDTKLGIRKRTGKQKDL